MISFMPLADRAIYDALLIAVFMSVFGLAVILVGLASCLLWFACLGAQRGLCLGAGALKLITERGIQTLGKKNKMRGAERRRRRAKRKNRERAFLTGEKHPDFKKTVGVTPPKAETMTLAKARDDERT